MSLRLIEVIAPSPRLDGLSEQIEGAEGIWVEPLEDGLQRARILAPQGAIEAITDRLRDRHEGYEGFQLMLFIVEAALPEVEVKKEEASDPNQAKKGGSSRRISREELHADLSSSANVTLPYVFSVLLSTLVAAIGLLRDDVAIIIGAMVIAPLLGPNVALALATTLGDLKLGIKALKTIAVGVTAAGILSVVIGGLVNFDPATEQIASRALARPSDVLLALAAGAAGALAFTTGIPTALIGVMVAVALLPPLVTMGLLLGSGHGALALGSLTLLATNVTSVNFAAVATFLARRIRPRSFWDKDRARQATRIAMAAWLLLLSLLLLTIVLVFD